MSNGQAIPFSLGMHDLYVMHTASWLNPIFRQALRFLEPTRHDPVLRRFWNAHELHG